jgi:MFS family permease
VALLISVRLAFAIVAAFTLANMVGYSVAEYPLLASIVMAAAVLLYGLTLRIGIATLIVVAPTSVAFTITQPPTVLPHDSMLTNLLVLAAVCLIAGVWGITAGAVVGRKVPNMPPTRVSWRSTWIFAGMLTAVCGVVMLVVELAHLPQDGAWILLTILIVSQPGMHRTWRKVGDRLLGTFAGFGVALVFAFPLHGHPMALTVAAIFLFGIAAYLMLAKRPYWQFVMFLTPGVVLVVGASTSVLSTDINRVWSTVVGAAIAVAMLLVLRAIGIRDREDPSQVANS